MFRSNLNSKQNVALGCVALCGQQEIGARQLGFHSFQGGISVHTWLPCHTRTHTHRTALHYHAAMFITLPLFPCPQMKGNEAQVFPLK